MFLSFEYSFWNILKNLYIHIVIRLGKHPLPSLFNYSNGHALKCFVTIQSILSILMFFVKIYLYGQC